MNGKETRQYEMLLRVRDFGTTYRQLFASPGAASDAFADVAVAIDDLAATNLATITASAAARAERKGAARAALNDLLLKVSHTAKVLRTPGRTIPAFRVTSRRPDQELLTTARQFARDAAALEAEFTAHGMPPTLIPETAHAFETAMRDRGMSRADLTAARARTSELLSHAVNAVRTLDVIINNQLGADPVIQAVWEQARRVEDPRRSRAAGVEEPPAAPAAEPETATTPEAAAV